MHALLAKLSGERLRELAYRSTACAVCGKLRAAAKRAEGARKDESLPKFSLGCSGRRTIRERTPFFSPPSVNASSP